MPVLGCLLVPHTSGFPGSPTGFTERSMGHDGFTV